MIKINIIAIGKDKDKWVTDGCDHYLKLLKRFAKVEITALPHIKNAASLPPEELKKKEAEKIIAALSGGLKIALSDSGIKKDSHQFSKWLIQKADRSGGKIDFVIGGAFGLDESVYKNCDYNLSLSPITMSHQIIRLVLLEQLYRAFSISHNTDYHK